jgi:signal transduction histidine kinase
LYILGVSGNGFWRGESIQYPASLGEFQFAHDRGIMGWVVTHRQPVVVQDAANDPRRFEEEPHIVELTLAEGMGSFIHYPITIGDEVQGVFSVIYSKTHAAGEDELRLFQALLQRAALYIENARLYEQSQEVAVLEERARLARELHDAVTQTLFSASLLAEALPVTWEKNPAAGRELLQDLRGLSRGALAEMRTLLLELRPAALMETRLDDLLRQLGEAANGRSGIPVTVKVEGQAELPRDVQIAFYRITQEALNNVVKHARAQQATVHLHYQDGEPAQTGLRVVLTVRDDGRGFDPARIPPNHLGLGIMQERARSIGAMMTIESQPGHGTRLTVEWEQVDPKEDQ